MKRRTIGILIPLAVFVALAIALLMVFLIATRRPFPKTKGILEISGLEKPVEIIRDENGVPHIYAQTDHDLYFAQGFVHAQDRFWQMEFWRRLGAGRLSELFGETTLGTDRFIRTMGFSHIAREDYDRLSQQARNTLTSYAAGVNAYIQDRKPGELGLEFTLLKLQGVEVEIEPWLPEHTLTWLKLMAYDLGGNLQQELDRIALIREVGVDMAQDFYPTYRDDLMPYIVTNEELREFMQSTGLADKPNGRTDGDLVAESRLPLALLRNLSHDLVGIGSPGQALAIGKGGGVGSNSWVVSGDHTADGNTILANDPHLGIQMPSIWYEMVLHGPGTEVGGSGTEDDSAEHDSAGTEVGGFSFAGVPGIVIGHNANIAWGFTNVNPDVQDLYIEQVNPEDPTEYRVGDEWRRMRLRYETIHVKGTEEPVTMIVRETRNGPIVSDRGSMSDQSGFSFAPPRGIPPAGDLAPYGSLTVTELSLRWTALEPNRTFEAILALNEAQGFQEFRRAAELFDIPSQNLIYADVDGNIGYQLPGRIPIRRNHDGRLPVPGWDDAYQWDGYIPFADLPYVLNPDKGYIQTANQPVVSEEYPYLIHRDYNHGYRGKRIQQLIESLIEETGGQITKDHIAAVQADDLNLSALEILPHLLRTAVIDRAITLDEPEVEESAIEYASSMLASWDARMDVDSPEATLFAFVWQALVHEAFADEIPEELWARDRLLGGIDRIQTVLAHLLTEPENRWWDDADTPNIRETRDVILARAFARGWTEAVEVLGDRPDRWAWGTIHTATFESQTFGNSGIGPVEALFNRGPYPVPAGLQQVNSADYSLTDPFEVVHVSSMRQIYSPGDWDASRLIHTTGQSGHPYNRHYTDMIERWSTARYHDHYWSREALEQTKTRVLELEPKQ